MSSGCDANARRRPAQFISPIPKPKKHKSKAAQASLDLEDKHLSTEEQQYAVTAPGRGISVVVKLDEQLFRSRTPLEE